MNKNNHKWKMGEASATDRQPERKYGKLIKLKSTKRKLWQKV